MSAPETFGEEFLGWLEEETRARGVTWTGGLSEPELRAIEARERLRFPPDYRLFLATLGASRGEPRFHDWRGEVDRIRAARDDLAAGILSDVDRGVWLSAWGSRPVSSEQRRRAVATRIENAPPLLPVSGHRFLVATPCEPGNPVLSIVGTDAIVYGRDLREYLLAELRLDDVDVDDVDAASRIDFWGALILGDSLG